MTDQQARYIGRLGVIRAQVEEAYQAVILNRSGDARKSLQAIKQVADDLMKEINDEVTG